MRPHYVHRGAMLFLGTVKWTESLVVDGSVDSNMLYLGRDRYYWAFECVSSGIKMKQGGVLSVICRFHDRSHCSKTGGYYSGHWPGQR